MLRQDLLLHLPQALHRGGSLPGSVPTGTKPGTSVMTTELCLVSFPHEALPAVIPGKRGLPMPEGGKGEDESLCNQFPRGIPSTPTFQAVPSPPQPLRLFQTLSLPFHHLCASRTLHTQAPQWLPSPSCPRTHLHRPPCACPYTIHFSTYIYGALLRVSHCPGCFKAPATAAAQNSGDRQSARQQERPAERQAGTGFHGHDARLSGPLQT